MKQDRDGPRWRSTPDLLEGTRVLLKEREGGKMGGKTEEGKRESGRREGER